MQLRPDQLGASLQKGLAPLYAVHGNEPLLVIEAADAIRAAARTQGFAEREVLVAGQGFKWDELFLAEQERILRLLVERVTVSDGGAEIKLNLEGLAGLARELGSTGNDERRAA